MMNTEIDAATESILRCLTKDFLYGTGKNGRPLKRRKLNHRIFDEETGWPVFSGTDLEMVMNRVILGLQLLREEAPEQPTEGEEMELATIVASGSPA